MVLNSSSQQPIGNYIVDFVCFERKIIIELDGGQHAQEEQMRKYQGRGSNAMGKVSTEKPEEPFF